MNFILHSAGWLEGGLVMGYEKFVLDADYAEMMSRLVAGVDLSDNGLAMEALLTNGPGQHFLGTAHTMENFETAFWTSSEADVNSFEQWEIEGSKDSVARAHETWTRQLASYEPPDIDEAIDAELTEWVEQRKASFPDSNI